MAVEGYLANPDTASQRQQRTKNFESNVREIDMKAQYQPTSRSGRTFAAAAAIATVIVLFDFVAGLGDARTELSVDARATGRLAQVAIVTAPAEQTHIAR